MPLRAKADATDSPAKVETKDSAKAQKKQEKEERKLISSLGRKAGKKPVKLVGTPDGSFNSN